MLNKENVRELAYLVKIDNVTPIEGYDRVELAHVGGWTIVVGKGEFAAGDIAIYFEIDSKLPEVEPFSNMEFLVKKHYKIKTQKMCKSISQGMLVSIPQMGWKLTAEGAIVDKDNNLHFVDGETRFLTDVIGVTYAVTEDNKRKAKSDPNAKYKSMFSRHPKFARSKFGRWCGRHMWTKKFLYLFWGKKKIDNAKNFPTHFQYVKKTDQERCENMTWVLNDKTPYIKTQKCDGSSGTYILERKGKNKFEFYVCSRNVRMLQPDQECFYGDRNYYWEVAIKYDIENKLKDYLTKHPELEYVCWQGEICAPGIQKNPHNLKETHFYCFHMTDSKIGRYDIREAEKIWKEYFMEVVPIIDTNYILPDDFEEFKASADGYYDSEVCEGYADCPREGFVYYKTNDPNFSFKNVSRNYLLNH